MKIRTKLFIGFFVMVAITVFLGIITNSQSNIASDEYRILAEHDLLVIQNAEKLQKLVVDSEAGQRGFIITGDENFLEPYNSGVQEFRSLVELEKELVSDNPSQVNRLELISDLFTQWNNLSAIPEIELRKQIHESQENNLELLLTARSGQPILDEINQIIFLLKENIRDTDNVNGFLLLTKIETDIQDSETAQRGYLTTGNDEFLASFDKIKIELHENIQNLEMNLSNDEENLQLIYSVDKLYQKWEKETAIPEIDSRRLIEKHPSINEVAALIQEGTGKGILDEIRIEFDEFIKTEEELKDQRLETSLAEQELIRNVIITVLVISVIVAVIMASLIFYSIAKPLSKLENVVQNFKVGKYDEKIDIISNDELGDFSKSFEQIRAILLKKEKLKNIGELSARLAHDLKNPLMVIQGALSLIDTQLKDKDEITEKRFKMINTAIARMTHQIDDVMDFVRAKDLQLENHSLKDLIESAIWRMNAEESVHIEIPQNDFTLRCESTKLEILFVNLLSNAIDAINEDGTIKIRMFDENSHVRIEIEDSGPVIPHNVVENMFEPLFTTKESGTGLGLASCKTIVEQHEGKISVTVDPTIVSFTLSKNL